MKWISLKEEVPKKGQIVEYTNYHFSKKGIGFTAKWDGTKLVDTEKCWKTIHNQTHWREA